MNPEQELIVTRSMDYHTRYFLFLPNRMTAKKYHEIGVELKEGRLVRVSGSGPKLTEQQRQTAIEKIKRLRNEHSNNQ